MTESKKRGFFNTNPALVIDGVRIRAGTYADDFDGSKMNTKTFKAFELGMMGKEFTVFDVPDPDGYIHIPFTKTGTPYDWIVIFKDGSGQEAKLTKVLNEHFQGVLEKLTQITEVSKIKEGSLQTRERILERRPDVAVEEKLKLVNAFKKGEESEGRKERSRFEKL